MKLYKCDVCGLLLRAIPGEHHVTRMFGLDVCPDCMAAWNDMEIDEIRQLIIDEIRDRITEGSNR